MDDVIASIERDLMAAARRQTVRRRHRRVQARALLATAVAVLAVSGVASAVTGYGPLADVLGVSEQDPQLRTIDPAPDGVAVTTADAPEGERWTLAVTPASAGLQAPGAERQKDVVCFLLANQASARVNTTACAAPAEVVSSIESRGAFMQARPAQQGADGLPAVVWGVVPADSSDVEVAVGSEPATQADLSDRTSLSVDRESGTDARAFIALVPISSDGANGPWTEVVARVTGADGQARVLRLSLPVQRP